MAAGRQDSCVTPWPPHHQMRWSSGQTSLLRFNCADSLDRTNAASYFAAVQVPKSRLYAATLCGAMLSLDRLPAMHLCRTSMSDGLRSLQVLVEQSRRIGLVLEGPGLAQRAAVRSLQGHHGNLLHPAGAMSHSATGLSEEPAVLDASSQRPVGANKLSAHTLLLQIIRRSKFQSVCKG